MPASHQFNRRIAAIGAALALVALSVSSTFAPAFAQPSLSPSAEAGSTDTADAEAAASADATGSSSGGSSADGADASGGSTSGDPDLKLIDSDTDADAESADADGSDDNGDGSDDNEPAPDDGACAESGENIPLPDAEPPCEIDGELEAEWKNNELSLPKPNGNPGDLPKSWVGKRFSAPTDERRIVRVPAQDTSAEGASRSTGNDSDTDDSGQSVTEATSQAGAPTEYEFGGDGKIRAAGEDQAMEFDRFAPNGPNPTWTFEVKGDTIVASGEKYPDSDEGTAESDGSDGTDDPGSNDGSQTANGGSSNSASSDADRSNSASNDGSSDSSGNEDGASSSSSASSNSSSSTNSDSSSDSNSASNSGSNDRANSAADDDADGKNSDSDAGARSDGSRKSDSDSSGSDSSSEDDDGNDSDDPDGSPVGTADGNNTTPDPSNGNGSKDDERETIPGTAGDEWLPGDEDDSERPDYSDPVPQNPEAPTPKDDTDLITGGDKPSPRANQQPSTSFGESIVSTFVSSWPVFVLAASGMAAVGFIIYIMGRRGKRD